MTIENGKLVLIVEGSKKKKRSAIKLECLNPKKTKTVKVDLKSEWLSQALFKQQEQSLPSLDGVLVEFERNDNNDPHRIWQTGQEWDRKRAEETFERPQEQPKNVGGDRFHNPYNFVPALPRGQVTGELGDRKPAGHGRYLPDKWTGRIAVNLTTVTPLLIPDASEMTEDQNGHKTFPMRIGADGKPYLPPTSIKGMLRSAYEAVTNSRLAVFYGHDRRLAYRMPAKNTAKPARIEQRADGSLYLRILNESSCIGGAAKLPRYAERSNSSDKDAKKVGLKYRGNNQLPQHGDFVRVQLKEGKVDIIEPCQLGAFPNSPWRTGWVCVTGANIGGKQYERVFIQSNNDPSVRVNDKITELWENLITDYQEIHEKELKEREKNNASPAAYLGHKPGKTAWSRHIYDPDQLKLRDGILCYVELSEDCDPEVELRPSDVIALQPVTISRRLYAQKPADLLPIGLHPATDIKALSPADRVFGWVNQDGKGSYKGHVRIHSIQCQTSKEDAIKEFSDLGVPLAILGQPKPAQTRFYTSEDKSGTPIQPQQSKDYGYGDKNRGLRGRKVYPHHQGLPESYWNNPEEDRTDQETDGRYQDYRRPGGESERDSQNRSITSWVNPGTAFTFDIDVTNLSTVELGALLWLLGLPENYHHRLGGGKSLGFGSVRIGVDFSDSDLRIGQQWNTFYCSLKTTDKPLFDNASCISTYQKAVADAYEQTFDSLSFIKAFYRVAQGFEDGLPIHYPWNPETNGQPDPKGENFNWFVDNEQGDRWSLPSLASGESLPLKPRTTDKKSQGRSTPTIQAALARTGLSEQQPLKSGSKNVNKKIIKKKNR